MALSPILQSRRIPPRPQIADRVGRTLLSVAFEVGFGLVDLLLLGLVDLLFLNV